MTPKTNFIGSSESAITLRQLVTTMANSNATVMITGESGTGKELLARLLHEQSDRCGANFVPINCAAIPLVGGTAARAARHARKMGGSDG